MSFSAKELAQAVTNHVVGFTCDYNPDDRQKLLIHGHDQLMMISARTDWKWNHFLIWKK